MSTERQDRTLRRKPLPAALLALALAALAPYSAHSKVAASFQGRLTNEVQNGVFIARSRDALGRDTGYTLCALPEGGRVALVATAPESSVTYANGSGGAGGSPAAPHSSVTYAYDHLGRLSGVVADIGGAPRVFVYTRAPGTDLVTGYMTDGYSRWVSYEPLRPLVSAVTNVFGSTRISTFGYANDAAGRRTAISRGGAAFGALSGATDAYGYNARSEVTSARRTLGGDEVSGFSYDYAYGVKGTGILMLLAIASVRGSWWLRPQRQFFIFHFSF